MPVALFLALQAAQAPVPSDFDLARLRPIDFDLRGLRGAECEPREDGAIVVCGRRATPGYPLERMAREFATRPVVAEMGIAGNVTGRAYLEAFPMDRGAVSNRIMVGIKLPF
jgi:hypothetical protein